MSNNSHQPIVGVPASILQMAGSQMQAHATGRRYIEAIAEYSNCLPVIIPAMPGDSDLDGLLSKLDGILLTGGRANVEPHHFGGPPFPDDEPIDPERDNFVLPLIRASIERRMPVFGVCRGIQEMNVALGGSLHYRIHLLPDKNDHRMPRGDNVTPEDVYKLRHMVNLTPGGLFAGLVGQDEFQVNSLHGQGIDRLADDFEVEAVTAEDDVVEGIRLKNDESFTVGVQWHTEWKPGEPEHLLSRRLYEAFGEAIQAYADRN